ncbi:MAG: cyclolysin secretion protein CyaE [Gemmatimonadaceae bacterium]
MTGAVLRYAGGLLIVFGSASARAQIATQRPAPAPGGVAAADPAAQPIGLAEAIALAQRSAPTVVQARGQVRTGHAEVRSAYGSFIPSVMLSAGTSRQDGQRLGPSGQLIPYSGDPWSYNDGLTASVQLFDGGRRFFQLGVAHADVRSADANEVAQRFATALNVKQQYFAVISARESEAAAMAQVQQAEQQLRSAVARVRAGAATKSDSLRSGIQVGNARLALVQAQSAVIVANASLTRLVATPFTVTAASDDSVLRATEPLLDTLTLTRLAEAGPAVMQASAQLDAAGAAHRAARTPYLPTVDLSYSRSGNGTGNVLGGGSTTGPAYANAFRLSLSYPLFNQFTREEQVTRTGAAEDNAEATLRDARFLARQYLTQYLAALRTADQRVTIGLASVAAADEDLRVQQQRYSLGASTLVDLLISQTQLNQARADLIKARYDLRVARAQIEAVIGQELRP